MSARKLTEKVFMGTGCRSILLYYFDAGVFSDEPGRPAACRQLVDSICYHKLKRHAWRYD